MNGLYQRLVLSLLCVIYLPAVGAVSVGMVDDFQDGSTMNWTAGGFNPTGPAFPPNPPANVANGGPTGAGDNYLIVTGEGGAGPGSKLTTFNLAQWGGDYPAAGITHITLQVNNFSVNPLNLRLELLDSTFGNRAVSTVSADVPALSGWIQVSFGVEFGDLTAVAGFGMVAATLADVLVLRIMHNPNALDASSAPSFAGQVGFDNISAVPLPAAGWLLMSGLGGLLFRRRSPI